MIEKIVLLLYVFLPGLYFYGLIGEYDGIFVFEASKDNFAFVANPTSFDALKSISVNGDRVTLWSTPDCLFGINLLEDLSPTIKDSVMQVKHLLIHNRHLLSSIQNRLEMNISILSNMNELKKRLVRESFSIPMNGKEGGGLSRVMSQANGLVMFVYVDQQVLMKPVNCLDQIEEDLLSDCIRRLDEHRKYMDDWNHYQMPEA